MPSPRRLTFVTLLLALLFALVASAPASSNDTSPDTSPDPPEDIDPPTVGDPGPAVDFTADGNVTVTDDDGEAVKLPVLPSVNLPDDATKDRAATERKLNSTVDGVMDRLGLAPAEIPEEKKVLSTELDKALGEFLDDSNAARRDLSSDHVFDDTALEERDLEARLSPMDFLLRRRCVILAAILRPFVVLGARLFQLANPGVGLSPLHEHMFFLYPLHRPLFDSKANARIWFHANWIFSRFWSNVAGVTFGRRVYIRAPQVKYGSKSPAGQKDQFYKQVHLIAHEFQHVQQYRNLGWSINKFAFQYLYLWCRAGQNYAKNPMEVAAETAANKLNNLLQTDRRFFEKWYAHRLRPQLGYPVQTTYHDCGKNRRCLKFQKGEMEVITTTGCYRKKIGSGSWTKPKCG